MSISELKLNQIHAMAAVEQGGALAPFSYEPSPLGPFEVEIEISHCGLCHSDLHLLHNDWQNTVYPLIPGHEIIGKVIERGQSVQELALGQRVGVGWQRSSCQQCQWCHQGENNLCAKQEATCVGHYGGFAQRIRVDSRFAFAIPELLSSENAAPLLCGGATVFSPLIQHQVNGLSRIAVVGIGGLGHLAIQFASAFGAEVYALSTSQNKEEEAKKFGAHHFVDEKSLKRHKNSFDLILMTSSSPIDWDLYLSLLRPKGKLCILGAPPANIEASIFSLLPERKTICASNIASPPDIQEMLRFAAMHQIVAQTELFEMSDANRALQKLAANEIRYRAVLTNNLGG